MKKRIGILCAMVFFMGIPCAVKASEYSRSGDVYTSIKSYGNIFYEDATGSVRIYAEDITLLQAKLASIPDEIFDPVLYSHTHVWEYLDITDQGHTKHCDGCGSKYDLVNQHNMTATKESTISFDGQEYQGYEYTCVCGYKWKEETAHNLIYTPKDDTYHAISCALAGTPYCPGIEYDDISHGITLQPTDASHHQRVCGDCGYKGAVEECVFYLLDADDAIGDEAIAEVEVRKYCECGNYILEPQTEVDDLNVTELEAVEIEETEEKAGTSGLDELPEISVSGNSIENQLQTTAENVTKSDKEGEYNL